METIITSREAYDKYNQLLSTVIIQIQEYAGDNIIDFEENGFEDLSGNDIYGVDNEKVYMNDGDFTEKNSYSLHELDLLDAIKIIGDLENPENRIYIEHKPATKQ